jgi:zinc-ribbon domain
VAIYIAAILIVAAVALFVAAPLSGGFLRRRRSTNRELDFERLEHDRGLAVQGLRELEFDHEMGKLEEVDYRDLKRSLEDRALAAMTAIERLRGAPRLARVQAAQRPSAPRAAADRPAPTPRSADASRGSQPIVNYCPQCGAPIAEGHKFCTGCGASLSADAAPVAAQAE